MRYVALIHKEPGSAYGISFPDFPGCISAGVTVEEAVAEGASALALHCADWEALPPPTPPEAVDSADAALMVLVDAPAGYAAV